MWEVGWEKLCEVERGACVDVAALLQGVVVRLNGPFGGFGPRHRALTVARWTDRYILARPVAPGTLHIELHAAAGLRDLPGSVALRTLARRFQEALPVTIRTDILARDIEAHDPAPASRPEPDVDLGRQV